MTDLLALDPSVRSPGVAVFRDGLLRYAAKVKVPTEYKVCPQGERWQRVAECICDWVRHNAELEFPRTIVYERPQIYVASKAKGDPNDLIALAAVGAAVVATYQATLYTQYPSTTLRIKTETPTPAEWAGQIPKATKGSAKDSPRALRILSRLSDEEKARVPDQHDALDAIGLGLHSLGRLGIRRVYRSE